MRFWELPAVPTVLILAVLLLGASALRRSVPFLRKLGIPDSMVAGFAGLVLGSSALELLPLDVETLELIVYHGLAVIFIAVGLQEPVKTKGGGGARSVAFALPVFAALQGLVGISLALALSVHPGFGSLLPLGFQQGPGQALSLGEAWEPTGLVDGGQVGLIIAAAGFAWAVFIGVPLVAIGRRLGWTSPPPTGEEEGDDLERAALAEPVGRCCQVPRAILPALVKADCVRLKPAPSVNRLFMMHWMNSPTGRKNAEAHSHGVGRLRINMKNMRELAVPLAPAAEQHRIVAEVERRFSVLDYLEATVERTLLRCTRLRQSILKRAFEGKLVPQDPNDEPASELLARIQAQTA